MMKGTLLTISAVATLAVIGGAYLLLRPSDGDGGNPEKEKTSITPSTQWTGPLPREVAEKFRQADTSTERLKWVRNPTRVAPLMEAFYGEGPGAREEIVTLKPMKPAHTTDSTYQRFEVTLKDGSSRLLPVILSKEGAKVDFECYARYGSESWPDLLTGKATEAEVVRVTVAPAAYYNYAFSDDKIWRSFVARSPDLEDPFYVYVRRGSMDAKRLASNKSGRPARVTLAIRSVEGSHQQRQFEVRAVHGMGWVVADPDDTPES